MAKTPSPKRRYGDGRVEFLALLEPITEAVERGHTLRSIFDKHLGKSGMSYAQFARYVARYVRKDDKPNPQPALPGLDAEAPAESPAPVQPVERKPDPAPTVQPKAGPRPASGIGARFQHSAKPDDDDKLI